MLRTAEEILKSDKYAIYVSKQEFTGLKEDIIKAVNEARKEAIEECAEIALPECDKYESYAVNIMNERKESILSLIKELT